MQIHIANKYSLKSEIIKIIFVQNLKIFDKIRGQELLRGQLCVFLEIKQKNWLFLF